MSFFSRLFSKDTVYIEPDKYAHKPVPPCGAGNFYQHYWQVERGWGCDQCKHIRQRERDLIEEERKNKALAKAIVDELEARGFK